MSLNRVEKIDNLVQIKNILLSVYDKRGLDTFVRGLVKVNPEVTFYSTGGTYKRLQELLGEDAEKRLKSVSGYTGQPEMQGGLVKTLDFKIYLGLLSETYNEAHLSDIERTAAVTFDMVVVNLYPFTQFSTSKEATLEDCRTNIDIGGPCMLRASAKNFLRVASVCDPSDYEILLEELNQHNGKLSLEERYRLAVKSFTHTANYDTEISAYLSSRNGADLAVYSF